MNIITVTAQILGIAAMVLSVLSIQCRSNRNFFLCQEFAGVLFVISFCMFGAWSGAMMNFFGIIRPELLRHEKTAKSAITLYGLLLLLAICALTTIFVFHEKYYLILIVAAAQTAGTYAMWTQNGKSIRLSQLFAVSPLWLLYNFLLPIPSIGGILNETINIISSILALYRYRKTGFTRR